MNHHDHLLPAWSLDYSVYRIELNDAVIYNFLLATYSMSLIWMTAMVFAITKGISFTGWHERKYNSALTANMPSCLGPMSQ